MDFGRFKPFRDVKFIGLLSWDAVVANEWVGKDENLGLVGRVCQRFGVTNHASLEN